MATFYRCDKCHSEFMDKNEIKTITIPRYWVDGLKDEYQKELCKSCLKKLEEFLYPEMRVMSR